jgi:hypothetical protein
MITKLEEVSIIERNKLINKNLILSKNLERSPIFSKLKIQANVNNEILQLNQIRVDIESNLNNLSNKDKWVNDVGGVNQEIERNNQIFQNRYRDSTLKEFKIEEFNVGGTPQFVSDKLMLDSSFNNSYDKYSIVDYYQNLDGRYILNKKPTSKNVLDDAKNLRETTLSTNHCINIEQNPFSVQYNQIKNNSNCIDKYNKFYRYYNIDNFYEKNYIEKDKTNFDLKHIINENNIVGFTSDLISNNTKFKSSTTVYDVLKRGLLSITDNESELGKIGLKVLTNQYLYNVTKNNIKKTLSNSIENIKNKDPFFALRYEITVPLNKDKSKLLNFIKNEFIGINNTSIEIDSSPIISIDELMENKLHNRGNQIQNLNLIEQTGLGHQQILSKMLNLNKLNLLHKYYFEDKELNLQFKEKDFIVEGVSLPLNKPNKIGFNWYSKNLKENEQNNYLYTTGLIKSKENNILNTTFNGFYENQYKTLVDFKSSAINKNNNSSEIQSKYIKDVGVISKGSNILKTDYAKGKPLNGYDEFCRVWTANDQYDKPKQFIRKHGLNNYIKDNNKYNTELSVLEDPGFIKISEYENEIDKNPKKFMLSLENLAWSDNIAELPINEIGNGDIDTGKKGRIMWFPPYALTLSETITPNYTPHTFIGRGEPVYTYNNTTETMSISFMMLCDYPKWLKENRVNLKTKYEDYIEKGDGEYSRFFAGCLDDINIKQIQTNETEIIETTPTQEIENNEVILTAYFPNDVGDRFNEFITTNKYECGETYTNKKIYIDGVKSNGSVDSNGIWKDILKIEEFNGLNETLVWQQLLNEKKFNEVINKLYKVEIKNNDITSINKNTKNIIQSVNFGVISNGEETLKNVKDVNYVLPIKYGEEYKIGNNNVEDYKALCSFSFKEDTNRTYPFYRIGTDYIYTQNSGLNNEIKLVFEQDVNNSKYLELKQLIDNANESGILNIEISGFSSTDIDNIKFKLSQIDDFNKIFNSFLSFRRIKTIISEFLPNLFKGNLQINNNTQINFIITNKYTEESNSKGIPTSNESAKDRKVEIKISATGVSKTNVTKNITTNVVNSQKIPTTTIIDSNINNGYFKRFTEDSDIIFNEITNKIDYFHPAFHSQTPEDLNTRIVFLKQCTRQAPIEHKNIKSKNLVFGKQPVCILRIGDYVHTKVIINNMTFAYDNLTWDLNPEGVGVQPMFIKVTLGMNVIGSQDITGPINELKTALSYNLTANTSIYEPKARKKIK